MFLSIAESPPSEEECVSDSTPPSNLSRLKIIFVVAMFSSILERVGGGGVEQC